MAGDACDAAAFREFEHDGWNRLYAGYHRHWEHLTSQIVPQMLAAAGITGGMHVLDVASGPGYVSGAAAARGASTVGLDLSENMARLAGENFPGLAFQVGDAEDLPFADGVFDAVLINFGVLHFPNADKALAEAYRVLRTGGRLAFTAWAGPEDSALGIVLGAIAREGTLEVDLPAGTPIFRFADHDGCRRVLEGIGFSGVDSTDVVLAWRLPRPDLLMETMREATARISGLLRAQDPAVLPAIAAAMTEACKPFDRGEYTELPMPAVLTRAAKA